MDREIETQGDISLQLERLKKWQADQQKILIERQNAQREILGLEHKKVFQLLCISSNSGCKEKSSAEFSSNLSLSNENQIDLKNNYEVESKSTYDSADFNDTRDLNQKKPFLKRGQGLIKRFKIHPDNLRLSNLPKYKFANAHKGKFDLIPKTNKDYVQQKKLLKSTFTPSLLKLVPPVKQASSIEKLDIKDNFDDVEVKKKIDPAVTKTSEATNQKENIIEPILPIPWGKILDPHCIKTQAIINIPEDYSQDNNLNFDDTGNLSIFELLEKKAQEGSFDLNNSRIKRWIKAKAKKQVENSLVDGINPIVEFKKTIGQNPFINSSDSSLSDCEEDTLINKDLKQDLHVRFSDNIVVNEIESETDTVSSADLEPINVSKTSTPNEKLPFEKFKAQLFGSSDDNINSVTLNENSVASLGDEHFAMKKQEIIERTNVLKIRLADLESEIATFKKNNLELIRLKQEHELEKINAEREKKELYEQINDEKINLEIYLHDERIKIEQERAKVQKLLKDQKIPNRKEREEITKLKDEIEKLTKEMKNKETDHVSAQSRLRAQIRTYDKNLKELNKEIDRLKKENRKLESENLRLNRDSNNKMLHEINRNIAKLTPKLTEVSPPVLEITNSNYKTVKPLVVSHKNSRPGLTIKRKTKGKSATMKHDNNFTSSSDIEDTETYEDDATVSSSDEKPTKFLEKTQTEQIKIDKIIKPTEQINNSLDSFKDKLKREIQNSDGSKDIWYPNGNLKKISADGMVIRMLYYNKDIKETNINEGTVKYYYSETNTWHTTYLDGLEILEFPNGQTEHRYKDATIEVHFPNGSIRITNPTDDEKSEEWRYPDGTNLLQMKNGDKILTLANGQKEIHTKLHKRREYPDGTVKLVYPDGSQETRYSNGRVRLKDKEGNLVMDSLRNKY